MSFKVAQYPGVAEQIQALAEEATLAGIKQIYLDALRQMVRHLESNPLGWGDPEYRTNLEGGVVCHAIIDPLIVRFVVFEAQNVVFVREIRRLPVSLFDRQ
jgi:hypothetical protein